MTSDWPSDSPSTVRCRVCNRWIARPEGHVCFPELDVQTVGEEVCPSYIQGVSEEPTLCHCGAGLVDLVDEAGDVTWGCVQCDNDCALCFDSEF